MSGNASHNDDGQGNEFVENWLGVPNVSQKLWSLAYWTIGCGLLVALMGVFGLFVWPGTFGKVCAAIFMIAGGISAGFGGFLISQGLTDISPKPVEIGVLTIWGRRIEVLLNEGQHLLAPFWPLNVDIVREDAELRNCDYVFEDVPCANSVDADGNPAQETGKTAVGGIVTVKVSVTIGPDRKAKEPHTDPITGIRTYRDCAAKRVIDWQNRGSREGVESILEDMLNEGVRHLAGQFDWEAFTFLKAPLTVALLAKVADIDFKRLPRLSPNGPFAVEPSKVDPDMYHDYPDVEYDPLAYLLEAVAGPLASKEERARRLVEIETFLRIARLNGVSDIIDLGAHIARINVTHIVANAELMNATQKAAIEKQERQRDKWDTETGILLAKDFMAFAAENGTTMSPLAALELSRIDRKRASESIVRVPKDSGDFTTGAAIGASVKTQT